MLDRNIPKIFYLLLAVLTIFLFVPINGFFADFKIYSTLILILGLIKFKSSESLLEFIELKSTSKKLLLFFIIMTAHFIWLKYQSYRAIQLSGSDFAHFDYAVFNGYLKNPLNVSIKENDYYVSLLGNHFSPVLFLFSPFHLFFSSHFMLPFFQAIIYSASIIAFYFLVKILANKNNFKYPNALSLIFCICYGLFPFNLMTIRYEFHHEILYLLFVIAAYIFYELKRPVLYVFLILAILTIKEEAGLVLSSFFVVLIFREKYLRKLNIGLLFFSIIYCFLCLKVFMPIFQLDSRLSSYAGFWSHYGTSLDQIMVFVLKNPLVFLRDIFLSSTWIKLYGPLLLIPLLSFNALMPMAAIGIHFSSPALKTLPLYYSSPIIPLLFISFVMGFFKLSEILKKNKKYLYSSVVLILFLHLVLRLGTYNIDRADPSFGQLKSEIEQILLQNKDAQKIYISGNLLSVAPFDIRFKRIWTSSTFTEMKKAADLIVIGKTVNNYPLGSQDREDLIKDLYNNKMFISQLDNDHFAVFKKNIP